ncbi:MAG TPA: putative lipid II flippase FtsW [Clostridiales bacterium]|nr:putative lipid II flippase FtsW [Clostridiales bacterium]
MIARACRRSRPGSPDPSLFLIAITLASLGLIMILSASLVKAEAWYGDPAFYLRRQLLWLLIGLGALVIGVRVDYRIYRRWATPIMLGTTLLLVAVLLPGVAQAGTGARRWMDLGILAFQPAELAKLAVVIYAAVGLSGHPERLGRFTTGILPWVGLMGAMSLLILAQPDLGTAIHMAAILFFLLFMAGARPGHLGILAAAAVPAVGWAVVTAEYRLERLLAFLRPFDDPLGAGFQIIQSLYALGSGGIFGVGLGRSVHKHFYLPEQHTDFIFAVLAEELGLVGGAFVLLLFLGFAWRGYLVAVKAPDTLGSLLAAGVTSMIMLQATMNIGVVTHTLPITGIPLPFLSFGGSSLVTCMAGVGILLNISRYCRQ